MNASSLDYGPNYAPRTLPWNSWWRFNATTTSITEPGKCTVWSLTLRTDQRALVRLWFGSTPVTEASIAAIYTRTFGTRHDAANRVLGHWRSTCSSKHLFSVVRKPRFTGNTNFHIRWISCTTYCAYQFMCQFLGCLWLTLRWNWCFTDNASWSVQRHQWVTGNTHTKLSTLWRR